MVIMHEVSICQSIINSLETGLEYGELEQVREVHMKVGLLSCIDPDILAHVFSFMIPDTPLQQAELKIELVEVLAECECCHQRRRVEQYRFICPECGQPLSKIIEGNELTIDKIFLENPVFAANEDSG